MNNRNFEQLNIEFEIRVSQYTPVPDFNQFGELPSLGSNLPNKLFREMQPENKLFYIKNTITWQVLGGFSSFQVVSKWF